MKKIIFTLLLVLVSTTAYAKSYIDAQLKNVDKNVKYNTVQKHAANYNKFKYKKSSVQAIYKALELSKQNELAKEVESDLKKNLKIYE